MSICVIHSHKPEKNVYIFCCLNLRQTLDSIIRIVNYIRRSALNGRLFAIPFEDFDSDYKVSLSHTEARWLSKDKMLFDALYELNFTITRRISEIICRMKANLTMKNDFYLLTLEIFWIKRLSGLLYEY